mgnify:CR=1 FL=1
MRLALLTLTIVLGAVSPTPKERVEQGLKDFEAGRYLEAERKWELALRSQPSYLKSKIKQHLRMERLREALELANRLRTITPRDSETLELSGQVYLLVGQRKSGQALLRLALKSNPDLVVSRLLLARAALDDKDLKNAQELLQHPLPPSSAEAKVLRGRLALLKGDHKAALEELQLAAELDPSNTDARYQLALTHLAASRPKKALQIVKEGLQLLPGNESFRLLRIRAQLKSGELPRNEVRGKLQELVDKASKEIANEARLLLVTLLEEMGSFEEALQLCLAATPRGKGRPRSLMLKASNLYMKVATEREKRGAQQKADFAFARSIELLQKALADDPSQPATRALLTERYIELGQHYFKKGKSATSPRLKQQLFGYSIFNLERAIELEPKTENRAHHLLGQVLNHLERHEEALLHFKRIKTELSHFVESIYSYGESCLKLRKFLDASVAFRRVVHIQPTHWRAHRDLALTYWHLKALAKAEVSFKKALALHTKDPTIWYYMGKIRLGQGRYNDAKTCLQKVIALTKAKTKPEWDKYNLDAQHLLQELPSRQKADKKLRALGGKPREDEINRRLYGR